MSIRRGPLPPPSFQNLYSLNFDGVDDYIDISNPIPLGLTSISFWMKSTDTAGNKSITNGLGQLSFIGTSPLVRLSSNNYRYFADQVANFDGNWHHWFLLIAGSGQYDISSSRLFVDGAEVLGGSTIGNSLPLAWSVSQIGKGFYGPINASIDEFAIWQSDETANISTIYNSGTPTDLTSLNPVAWYRNGDNGTWKSPQWLIPSNINKDKQSNYSFVFDGVDDYIDTTSSIDFSGDFTVSAWVYPTSFGTYNMIFGFATSGTDSYISFKGSLGNMQYYDGTNNIITLNGFASLNTWQNIVVRREGTTISFFNNNTKFESPNASTGKDNSGILSIGRWTTSVSYRLDGKADEVSVWSSALTDLQISDIYNSGEPTTITGAVAHWKLGEGSTFTGGNWTAVDEVGGNNGTSANMTIEDRVGDASNSTSNAVSLNMDEVDRETDVPT